MGLSRYKFCKHLTYFETGYGKTGYFKYVIALFGLSSLDVKATMWAAFFYAISCYIVGRIWFNMGFQEDQKEVLNQHDLFVKQMRKRKI